MSPRPAPDRTRGTLARGVRVARMAQRVRRSRQVFVVAALCGVLVGAAVAVFALEVPYTEDLAHRSLLPALVASATSYLAFVILNGGDRLFVIGDPPPHNWRYLVGP